VWALEIAVGSAGVFAIACLGVGNDGEGHVFVRGSGHGEEGGGWEGPKEQREFVCILAAQNLFAALVRQ
jgi:hypothetical protein